MGAMTETLRLVIGGDSTGATRALKDVVREGEAADRASRRWGQRFDTAANYALGAGTALAGVMAVSTKNTIAYGQSIDDIADLSNLSAEASSRLAGQLYYYDISLQNAGNSVKFFEKYLDAARQGGEAQIETFARLGISLSDLKTQTDEDLLFRVRDAMASLGDKTARTARTLQLFGRSGADMADWLDAAPEDMAHVNEQLEKMGLVWDGEKVRTWQDLVDAQRDMRISMMGLQMAVAQPGFIKSITELVTQMTKLLEIVRPLAPALPYVTAGLLGFGGTVKTIRGVQAVRGLFAGRAAGSAAAAAAQGAPAAAGRIWRNDWTGVAAMNREAGRAAPQLQRVATSSRTSARWVGGLGTNSRTSGRLVGGLGGAARATRGGLGRLNATIGSGSVGTIAKFMALGVALDFTTSKLGELMDQFAGLNRDTENARKAEADVVYNAGQNLERVKAKYGVDSPEYKRQLEIFREAVRNAQAAGYDRPWWTNSIIGNKNAEKLWNALRGIVPMAEGGDYMVTRPTLFLAGEGGHERATFTPVGRRGPAAGVVVNLNVGRVVGTDDRAARQLWASLKPVVMQELRLKGAMGNG